MAHSRGRKTDYSWQGFAGQMQDMDLALANAAVGVGGSSRLDIGVPLTLTRIHGVLQVVLNATAVDERCIVAFGLIVVSVNAISAGVASLPHPFTNAEAPWILHAYMAVDSGNEGAVNTNSLTATVVLDSKAMRRVKPDSSLVAVAEIAQVQDQGGTLDLQYGFRVLAGD